MHLFDAEAGDILHSKNVKSPNYYYNLLNQIEPKDMLMAMKNYKLDETPRVAAENYD
jgi:hypothetical protein